MQDVLNAISLNGCATAAETTTVVGIAARAAAATETTVGGTAAESADKQRCKYQGLLDWIIEGRHFIL